MKKTAVIAGFLGLFATSAAGREAVYECELRTWGQGGWTPEEVHFALAEDRQSARVIDPFINHVAEGPVEVPVTAFSGNQLRMEWSLALPTTTNSEVFVSYNLTFNPADNSVRMRVRPGDDLPDRGGRGTCTMRP